jgi:hypothetical protein
MSVKMRDALNDLEDARTILASLERQHRLATQTFVAGLLVLFVMTTVLILTGQGLFAWLLFPAIALFTFSAFGFFHTMRTVQDGQYSWDRSQLGRLDIARSEVRRRERTYQDLLLSEQA